MICEQPTIKTFDMAEEAVHLKVLLRGAKSHLNQSTFYDLKSHSGQMSILPKL